MEMRDEELRRQREIVAEHLRWLDQEIARATSIAPPQVPVPSVAPVAPIPVAFRPVDPARSPEAEVLPQLSIPELDSGSIKNDVRRGCMIYVVIASVLLAGSLGLALWLSGE